MGEPNMLEATFRSGFGKNLGVTLDAVSGDEVRATWSVSPEHHQDYGIVHGGVYCSIVEHVASVAAGTWMGDRGHVVGVCNTTHFIRAVRSGVLRVSATPLQRGRRHQLWQVFITDEQERLVAKGEVRFAGIPDAAAIG